VERIFLVESPAVTKVEIKSRGHVRRSRLYYLRGRTGKKARLRSKVRDLSRLVAPDADEAGTADAAAQAAEEEAVARVPEDAPEADAPPAAEPPENAGQPG
jgi:large subunit ribosomal protein L19